MQSVPPAAASSDVDAAADEDVGDGRYRCR